MALLKCQIKIHLVKVSHYTKTHYNPRVWYTYTIIPYTKPIIIRDSVYTGCGATLRNKSLTVN